MNGSKLRVDERSVLITLPALFKVIRQLHFSGINLFPPEKKKKTKNDKLYLQFTTT